MIVSSPSRIATYFTAALLLLAASSSAIKFDIPAKNSPTTKCICECAALETMRRLSCWRQRCAMLTSHLLYSLLTGNYALADTLVIVTVNSGPTPQSSVAADGQQVDVEIVDASHHNNVYLDKKDIRGETRMAINTHSQSDLGVCITNRLKKGKSGRAAYRRGVPLTLIPSCLQATPPQATAKRAPPLTSTSTLERTQSTTMPLRIRSRSRVSRRR